MDKERQFGQLTSKDLEMKQRHGGAMSRAASIAYGIGTKENRPSVKKTALRVKAAALIAQNPSSGMGVEQTPQRRARFPIKNITFSLFRYWYEKGSPERDSI